jgi:hypothetical protein
MKIILCGLILCSGLSSCYYIASINEPPVFSFNSIKGIRYFEVRRQFDNGIAIDNNGFHLDPEWQIYFTGNDSVKIFSAEKKKFMPYRIFHSHKNLFQFARRWFRVGHLSKDSILLQAMEVNDRKINETASNVYMTLYSEDYIKNTLRSNLETLKRARPNDSLFIKYKAIQANSNPDSAFTAREPVAFKSKSKILRVEKIMPVVDPNLGEFKKIDEYLNPAYRITIRKAYRDFKYSFYMTVDNKGKMMFKKFNFRMEPELLESKTKVANGIINIYLSNLMDVKPGSTLGYDHTSIVEVFVIGKAR